MSDFGDSKNHAKSLDIMVVTIFHNLLQIKRYQLSPYLIDNWHLYSLDVILYRVKYFSTCSWHWNQQVFPSLRSSSRLGKVGA